MTHFFIKPPTRLLSKRWLQIVIAALVVTGAMNCIAMTHAGFPEVIERGGRLCGCGYGDGYHACHSSGMRPLANLPPRTYPARVGTLGEKIAGCPTCRPRPLPGVDPIRARRPETFYHRFDRYAQQVSHRETHQNANRPVQRLIDPEQDIAPSYSQHDPQPNMREYDRSRIHQYGSPKAGHSGPTDSTESNLRPVLTADGEPVAPPISKKEMEEFREYQQAKRLRKKFEKYMIEPDEIEPNQFMGGPPVGTEKRRKLDEIKVKALKEKIRRDLAQDAKENESQSNPSSQDQLLSPSDRVNFSESESSSMLDINNDRPLPMDELLPPFPDENRLPEKIPTPVPSHDPDDFSPSLKEQLNKSDSIKPMPIKQTQTEFNAPMQFESRVQMENRAQSDHQACASQPEHRVAEVPRPNKAPESWRFIKQPR